MKLRTDVTAALVGALYLLDRLGRRSGVTRAEAEARLPGDELVANPMWQSTRATTIDAPPDDVWPWIVQMGFPSHRAGWYTPHWLDRLTFGIKQPSASEIRPELQHLEPGDRIPDSDDCSVYFTVAEVEPPRGLVLHSTRHIIKPIKTIDFSWAFILRNALGGKTRLYIRARSNYTPRSALPFVELVIGVGDFVNAGAMLRGMKRLVEGAEHSAERSRPPSPSSWSRRCDTTSASDTGRARGVALAAATDRVVPFGLDSIQRINCGGVVRQVVMTIFPRAWPSLR